MFKVLLGHPKADLGFLVPPIISAAIYNKVPSTLLVSLKRPRIPLSFAPYGSPLKEIYLPLGYNCLYMYSNQNLFYNMNGAKSVEKNLQKTIFYVFNCKIKLRLGLSKFCKDEGAIVFLQVINLHATAVVPTIFASKSSLCWSIN